FFSKKLTKITNLANDGNNYAQNNTRIEFKLNDQRWSDLKLALGDEIECQYEVTGDSTHIKSIKFPKSYMLTLSEDVQFVPPHSLPDDSMAQVGFFYKNYTKTNNQIFFLICITQESNYNENSKKVKDIPINEYVQENTKSFFSVKKWLQNPVQGSSFLKIYCRELGRWKDEELNEMATELVKCKDSIENAKAYKQRIVFQILKLIILHSITHKCSVSQEIVKELEQANSEECKETQSSEIKMLHDIVTRYHERNADDDMGELSNECEQLCITQTCEISNKEDGFYYFDNNFITKGFFGIIEWHTMKAVDSKKVPLLYYRDFIITKKAPSNIHIGRHNNQKNKVNEVATQSFSPDQSACLIQKKKNYWQRKKDDLFQQGHNDVQRDRPIFLHLLSSIGTSADDFEFVSSAYKDLEKVITVQKNYIEGLYKTEITNWKSSTADMKSVLQQKRSQLYDCNLSPATLLDVVHITAKQCKSEPSKEVKTVIHEQYRTLSNQSLDSMEKLALVPCFNYCSAFGYETGHPPQNLTKIAFEENIDCDLAEEKGIEILRVDLAVRTKKNNQIPVEKYLIDLMVVCDNGEVSKKMLDFLLGPECLKTEVWRNVFGHKSFSKVILNLFQSDFEKWHAFLQKLEDEKLLSENVQLFFTLFSSKEFVSVIALSNQWQRFFEDFVLKEKKIWTEESKILKTVEVCLNSESVTPRVMPALLDILWTHVTFDDNDIKNTMERLTNKILLTLQSNVEHHPLWLQQFHYETQNSHLWETLLRASLQGWLQRGSLDGTAGSTSHFHRNVLQLLSYPDFYKLPRTYLDLFINEVKSQQQKMALDGDFWNTEDVERVQQCLVQTSVDWALWNEVFDTMICVPTLTWEVETKREDPLISNMLSTQSDDIKDEIAVPRSDDHTIPNANNVALQSVEDEKTQPPTSEEENDDHTMTNANDADLQPIEDEQTQLSSSEEQPNLFAHSSEEKKEKYRERKASPIVMEIENADNSDSPRPSGPVKENLEELKSKTARLDSDKPTSTTENSDDKYVFVKDKSIGTEMNLFEKLLKNPNRIRHRRESMDSN
ncbi:hypothetical protein RFI_40139, partial [Reticulomyxa filosa]